MVPSPVELAQLFNAISRAVVNYDGVLVLPLIPWSGLLVLPLKAWAGSCC